MITRFRGYPHNLPRQLPISSTLKLNRLITENVQPQTKSLLRYSTSSVESRKPSSLFDNTQGDCSIFKTTANSKDKYKHSSKDEAFDFRQTVGSHRFTQKDLQTVTDVAGEVVEVGPGVQNFNVGDRVVSMLNTFGGGGLAEYAVALSRLTVKRPPEVSAEEGACLNIAALTALQALTQAAGDKLDQSGPSANLLITAASGGVGHYAVQLAKLGNAHVTATCGARNLDLVRRLGADEVLDYRTPDGAALKSPSGKKYDAVIHCATGIPWSTFEPNLSEKGKVIDITPSATALMISVIKKLTFSKKALVPLLLFPKAENLEFLVNLTKKGKLKTIIDSKFPLSKAEEAWAKIMDGHATGKIIVTSK